VRCFSLSSSLDVDLQGPDHFLRLSNKHTLLFYFPFLFYNLFVHHVSPTDPFPTRPLRQSLIPVATDRLLPSAGRHPRLASHAPEPVHPPRLPRSPHIHPQEPSRRHPPTRLCLARTAPPETGPPPDDVARPHRPRRPLHLRLLPLQDPRFARNHPSAREPAPTGRERPRRRRGLTGKTGRCQRQCRSSSGWQR
jgi:hypothetical protein